jgi:hypothetical protein
MVTIILAFALLIALVGLGIEIGVASWNIRRANRYQRRESAAEHTTERAISKRQELSEQIQSLDEYASKISWLLNFLYKRYDKFSDLEKEVIEGLKNTSDDTSIRDAESNYNDLKRALKIIRITVRASDRMENLMASIASQVGQIMKDFAEDEEEKKEEKPAQSGEDHPEASGTPSA